MHSRLQKYTVRLFLIRVFLPKARTMIQPSIPSEGCLLPHCSQTTSRRRNDPYGVTSVLWANGTNAVYHSS